MHRRELHISDEDLIRAVDGELNAAAEARILGHLVACETCRARKAEIESAIADFNQLHRRLDRLSPPADPARLLLKARMAEMIAGSDRCRLGWTAFERRLPALAGVAAAVLLVGVFVLNSARFTGFRFGSQARPIPDPRLTPGATLPVTREDLCAAGPVDTASLVPSTVARQVFAEYQISKPEPRAYEVDYLITPALGGSDNIRNFWPQPYGVIWNAHMKDALEDRLHQLVCAGQVDLATAQMEIARDWISAYKKYFHTSSPLPEHAGFLKDRPWE